MNNEIEEKKSAELQKRMKSVNLFTWMESWQKEFEERFRYIQDKIKSMVHINTRSLEDFKSSLKQYEKEHPNAKIMAKGFVFSTQDPTQNQEFKHETGEKMKQKQKKQTKKKPKTTKKSKK